MAERKIYATFFGDANHPLEWESEEEKDLMWFYDDLHCPNPISPMYFSVGGWWGPTCKYFYKRFGVGGYDWPAKKIGGYVYTAVVPPKTDADKVPAMFNYYGAVMPIYAETFIKQWDNEYVPELKAAANKMVGFDFEHESLAAAMIHLEDCLDLQERAFRIHWILNYAQAQASGEFRGIYEKAVGPIDDDYSLITVSPDDRNWDSLRDAWKMKQEICANPELKDYWLKNSVTDIMAGLDSVKGGKELHDKIKAYTEEYGWKPLWTHEYIYKLWIEDPTPIYEAIKSYVETDYDYEKQIDACHKSQADAIARARAKIKDETLRKEFEAKLEINMKMLPLTPNHHFYIDQAIYAHMRIMFLGIADMMVRAGKLDDREDIFMLTYDELRAGAFSDYDLRAKVVLARAAMAEAAKHQPRYWYGTVDEWQLNEEIYKQILWGYPEVFYKSLELEKEEKEAKGPMKVLKAIPGSSGVVEGTARVVSSPKEFDALQKGDIMICRMTNPGWIISFSKISGLVTDTGGALSHPAVVSREFGIPCVVGTIRATQVIKTGDRIRVNGDTGVVEILD
ncbi:MAG: PEP-utilizing enzyme [Oscillospiraceae bacterium]